MNKKTEDLMYEAQNVSLLTFKAKNLTLYAIEQQVLSGAIRDLFENLPTDFI